MRLNVIANVAIAIQLLCPWQLAGAHAAASQTAKSVHNASTGPAPSAASFVPGAVNLNLSSTQANFSAGNLALTKALNINVGGSSLAVTQSSMLTAAELVALYQVESTGHQTLQLGAQGNAVGGRLSLSSAFTNDISNLLVPGNVKLFDNFASSPTLSISGDLTDNGSFVALSTSRAMTTATLSANNIYVGQGAVLTSASGGSALHLSLNALNSIVNSGTISSSGDLNLTTNHLTNSGLLSAPSGNLNIQANAGGNLSILADGGTLQAQQVNVTNLSGNVVMHGGNYLSKVLNINAGQNNIVGNVGTVSGTVNLSACNAVFGASTAALNFGTLNVTGDPTYFNSGGTLKLASVTTTNGADLALVASGDVIVSGGTLNTTTTLNADGSGGGSGGNLTILAGVAFTTSGSSSGNNDQSTTLTIPATNYASATGGAINLKGVKSINTNGDGDVNTIGAVAGGNVILAAFSGSGVGSSLKPGTITVGGTINTYGNGDNAGNVTIIAGALVNPSSSSSAIQLFEINAPNAPSASGVPAQSGGNAGNVQVVTATPVLSSSISIINGAIQPGSGTINPGSTQPTSITFTSPKGALTINTSTVVDSSNAAAGNVTLTAGGAITVPGFIYANGFTIFGAFPDSDAGGQVTIAAGGNVNVFSAWASGGLGETAVNNGTGGAGGTVSITSQNGNITITPSFRSFAFHAIRVPGGGGAPNSDPSPNNPGGDGGAGGNVTLSAPNGSITLSAIEAGGGGGSGGNGGDVGGQGGNGGAGGSIAMNGKAITVQYYLSTVGGGGGGAGGDDTNSIAGGGGGGGAFGSAGSGGAAGDFTSAGGGGGGGAEYSGQGGPSGGQQTFPTHPYQGFPGNPGSSSPGSGGTGGLFGQGGGGGAAVNASADGGKGGDIGMMGGNNSSGVLGGDAGTGGSISVTAQSFVVKSNLLGFWNSGGGSALSPTEDHVQDSIIAVGPTGTINVFAAGSQIGPVYNANSDLSSTTASINPTITSGSPFLVGTNFTKTTTNGSFGALEADASIQVNGNTEVNPVTQGSISAAAQLTITVGVTPTTFTSATPVTPAELIALIQVGSGGAQNLQIAGDGSATNPIGPSSFNIAPANIPLGGFTTLVVPASVTANAQLASLTCTTSAVIDGTMGFSGGTKGTTLFTPSLTVGGALTNALGNLNIQGMGGALSLTFSATNAAISSAVGNVIFNGTTAGAVNVTSSTMGDIFSGGTAGIVSFNVGKTGSLNASLDAISGKLTGVGTALSFTTASTLIVSTLTTSQSLSLTSSSGSIIEASKGLITTPSLTLSASGDIGDFSVPATPVALLTKVGSLAISAATNAFVSNGANVTLSGATTTSDFLLNVTGKLTTGSVSSLGSISMSATSGIVVNASDSIQTTSGSILLNGSGASSTISIGNGASIMASSTTASLGDVTICIGSKTPVQVNTTPPSNVTPITSAGGAIFYGTNSITADTPGNTITANARTVTFSTGKSKATAITLGGGVTVTANSVSFISDESSASTSIVDTGDCDDNGEDMVTAAR